MTTAKIESKLAAPAEAGLEPHVPGLYAAPGRRVVGVVELRHVERTEPAPDSDKTRSVKLAITHLEIANTKQETAVREAMSALYLHRTADGTLDQTGQLELSDRVLELTGGELHAVEAARLGVSVRHWATYADRVLSTQGITQSELRAELKTIAKALRAVANGEAGTNG